MSQPEQPLTRHGRPVNAVFDLLGRDENDLTAALGFVLSRSSVFRTAMQDLLLPGDRGAASIPMEVRDDLGR